MPRNLEAIRRLVGDVTAEQLRYVDCFVGEEVGLFMPAGGACFYALTLEHTHPSYMFVLPFDDRGTVVVGNRRIAAKPGFIQCLSPMIPHHELPSELPPRYLAVMIAPQFFDGEIATYPISPPVNFEGELYTCGRELLPLFRQFMVEADNRLTGRAGMIHGLELQICHALIRTIFRVDPGHDRISSRLEIDRVIEYLHARLGEKVTVAEMARVACRSVSHFTRIFRQETGFAPAEYLKRMRLDRARKFLLADDKNLTEIALECGFGNSAYFSACFRKHFNVPPSEYRGTWR